MDIEMKHVDGIAAGQQLRSNDENDMVLLFYISSHKSFETINKLLQITFTVIRPSAWVRKIL